MKWLYALVGAGGFFGSVALTHTYMTSEVYQQDSELTNPPSTSIIVPTYNEEYFIKTALQSIVNQNIYQAYPDRFELIVADSQSTDRTPEIARRYTQNVVSMPKGKLNAKHLAILDAEGEVIVSVDGDCYYPPNFLNLILTRFEDPSVVAVGGVCLAESDHPLIKLGYVLQAMKLTVMRNELLGRGSAFRRDSYLQVGGYRLDFNQLDVMRVKYWEEIEFANRLKTFGKVVVEPRATVVTSPRLFYCRVPIFQDSKPYALYCEEIKSGERM